MTTGPNLRVLRRRIRRRMTAGAKVSRFEEGEYDPDLGYAPQIEVVLWAGDCHVRPASKQSQYIEVAEQVIGVRSYEVWLPVDAAIEDAPSLTVTRSLGDPELVGKQLVIVDRPHDDWQTAQRLVCQLSA